MSRLSVQTLPVRRRNPALSPARAAVSNLDSAVGSGQSGLRRALARRAPPPKAADGGGRDHADRGPALPADTLSRLAAHRDGAQRTFDACRLAAVRYRSRQTPVRDRTP
ncbi:hypothetical protein GCM10027360_39850 [Amycolatopsis echigonensis]